jgi:hypothetical protein
MARTDRAPPLRDSGLSDTFVSVIDGQRLPFAKNQLARLTAIYGA